MGPYGTWTERTNYLGMAGFGEVRQGKVRQGRVWRGSPWDIAYQEMTHEF